MKKKLELRSLNVESFVTNFNGVQRQTANLKGGTGGSAPQLCDGIDSITCGTCPFTINTCGLCPPPPSNNCPPGSAGCPAPSNACPAPTGDCYYSGPIVCNTDPGKCIGNGPG